MIGLNFKTNLVSQQPDHRSGKSQMGLNASVIVPAYMMDVLKTHHESPSVSYSAAPKMYPSCGPMGLMASVCATAGRIPFQSKLAHSLPSYTEMYSVSASIGAGQLAKRFQSSLGVQTADSEFFEQPSWSKAFEHLDRLRLLRTAITCVTNECSPTEQRDREVDQDPRANKQRSNSCQRQMDAAIDGQLDQPRTSELLCTSVDDMVTSKLDPRELSSQSSRVDSALSSDAASTSTSKSTSPTRPILDRQCSSSSMQSSYRLRVTHIVLLRGRHIPERVHITCRCCLQAPRKNRRRKLASAADRSRARARAPRRDSGSSEDSESTLTDARHFIQTFAYLPESASSDESDCDSDRSEPESDEASESDDDDNSEQGCESWSAESSSECESDSDSDADDVRSVDSNQFAQPSSNAGAAKQKSKRSNKSAEIDLELHFSSLGLASIGLHLRATPERSCDKSSEREQKTTNRSANSHARSQCVVVTVSQRTINMDCESHPESWSQLDTRCSSTGISYLYVVVGTPRKSPPVALELLKRSSSKAIGNTTTETPSERCDTETSSECYDTVQSEPAKKVRFACGSALVRVRPLYTWRFWSRRARQDDYLCGNRTSGFVLSNLSGCYATSFPLLIAPVCSATDSTVESSAVDSRSPFVALPLYASI